MLQHQHARVSLAALEALAEAPRFNRWMADMLLPYIDGDVLEIGAGIGNLTGILAQRARYVAVDIDPDNLSRLKTRLPHLSNLVTIAADAANTSHLKTFWRQMDTVVCLNVLEHIQEDAAALRNMYSCLRRGGRALILVPQGMRAFGAFDVVLQHCRRYSKPELAQKMIHAGFRLESIIEFNRITYPAWFFYGRILRRRKLNRLPLRLFDFMVPLWRRIDRFLPWPPTSLIAIGIRDN